jgi:hypothetical protein
MAGTSHVRQLPPGAISQAVPVQEVKDRDTWQLFDPPKALRSLNSPPAYRDCELFKITAEATKAAPTGDTLFEALVGDPDELGNLVFLDVLEGLGVLPANTTSAEWYLFPAITISRGRTRRAMNTLQVGAGLLGFVVEMLYK